MTRVYLSLGSNVDRYKNITAGLDALESAFGPLSLSPIYESESVGFKGTHFLNLIVAIDTDLELGLLSREMKSIEDQCGRDRSAPKFSPRTLDIDIVLYGSETGMLAGLELPRPEVYENAFVLRPLVDLNPQLIDPLSGERFESIQQRKDIQQKLWRVDFQWKNRTLSSV